MKLAITGGTGFVGSHLIDAAVTAGHEVRALTRREQQLRERVQWVSGSLDGDDRAPMQELVTEADAIVHVAGVINAADAAGFGVALLVLRPKPMQHEAVAQPVDTRTLLLVAALLRGDAMRGAPRHHQRVVVELAGDVLALLRIEHLARPRGIAELLCLHAGGKKGAGHQTQDGAVSVHKELPKPHSWHAQGDGGCVPSCGRPS